MKKLNKAITFSGLIILILFFKISICFSQSISAGANHSTFITGDGNMMTCGINKFGALGDGTKITRSSPVPIPGMGKTKVISSKNLHKLFLMNDGTVWGCGLNRDGELGLGDTTNSLAPVAIKGLSNVKAIAAGGFHSVFLKTDGTVWVCGANESGQLATADKKSMNTPFQIKSLKDVKAIDAGINFTLFLKNDGTVWGCGNNHAGQLGQGGNDTANRATPVQIKALFGIRAIACGAFCSMFLKNDSTVLFAGDGENGENGIGETKETIGEIVSPVGLTKVVAMAAGWDHTIFLKSDGTIWGSGRNTEGQLGDGTLENKSYVVQLKGNLIGVVAISGGNKHSLFLKKDGTIWSCGYGHFGQLGNGESETKKIPVQVMLK